MPAARDEVPAAPHPGPRSLTLPATIRAAIVAHARAEEPLEACGLVAGTAPAADGGLPTRWHPTRNRAASALRYEVHPEDLLRVALAIDDADEAIWGIVHSHVRSAARPSPTDVGLAFYPDALYLLVSLAASEADPATGAESLRAWRIVDGRVYEVALRGGPDEGGDPDESGDPDEGGDPVEGGPGEAWPRADAPAPRPRIRAMMTRWTSTTT